MSDTNFTYGETTVLADTDDIAKLTETIESSIGEVKTDTEDLNTDHDTMNTKLDNIATELSAIKKSVSDGKTLVAGAITAKGIDTATDAEFATIAANIDSIVTLDSAPGLEAQSYTPGTSNIVIGAGNYLKGDQTIVGDSNLVAANIAKGKSIFGVTGTYDPVSISSFKQTTKQLFSDSTSNVGITSSQNINGVIYAISFLNGTYLNDINFIWVVGSFAVYGVTTGDDYGHVSRSTSLTFPGPHSISISSDRKTITSTMKYKSGSNYYMTIYYIES